MLDSLEATLESTLESTSGFYQNPHQNSQECYTEDLFTNNKVREELGSNKWGRAGQGKERRGVISGKVSPIVTEV